jgi:hypothetical protein
VADTPAPGRRVSSRLTKPNRQFPAEQWELPDCNQPPHAHLVSQGAKSFRDIGGVNPIHCGGGAQLPTGAVLA